MRRFRDPYLTVVFSVMEFSESNDEWEVVSWRHIWRCDANPSANFIINKVMSERDPFQMAPAIHLSDVQSKIANYLSYEEAKLARWAPSQKY